MIVASFLMLGACWDGTMDRVEGGILLFGVLVYTWWCVSQGRKESSDVQAEFAHRPRQGKPRAVVVGLPALDGIFVEPLLTAESGPS